MTLRTQRALSAALDRLAERDADVASALARFGHPAPRHREPGLETLLRIVMAQQVSVAAAATLWRRLETALTGEVTAERLLEGGTPLLRGIGMSGRKADYALGLAGAVAEGRLDIEGLATRDDASVAREITALRGFGPWSAEIYLLFSLDRVDVFPADDLALQVGFQRLRRLERRPSGRELRAAVEPWSPGRGAGAVLLWHIYGSATLDPAGGAPLVSGEPLC
ncbi:MAG: DNA-3-methyladenine glycosylase 2 family protein [Geminicoccaceae bacterium]|nr:DNA-3-methyladenine glycosylase 2 family protein [Geminicoccaceae bacterium]